MRRLFTCRRTVLAAFGVACLTAISLINHSDLSWAIATIIVGHAGSFASEKFAPQPQVLPK